MTDFSRDYSALLAGANFRVIQVSHPWLDVFSQNLNGQAALLIRENFPNNFFVPDGKGFTVSKTSGGDPSTLTICSREPGVNQLFVRLVEYLIDRTSNAASKENALALLQLAVREFKAFSGRAPGRLTLPRVRGLFAELLFLQKLLAKGNTPSEALRSWKGPHNAEGVGMHDFVLPSGDSFEIKSTNHPSTEIRVSSALQLSAASYALHLVVVPLETLEHDSKSGQTILDLCNFCIEQIDESDSSSVSEFFEALAAIGFDPTDEHYAQWKFMAEPWKLFEIRDGFPELDLGEIPKAITKVRYSLELALLSEFEVNSVSVLKKLGDK